AAKDHTHPEFVKLKQYVDQKAVELTPKGEYADKSHKHDLKDISGTVTLSRVERGQEVATMLDTEFAPRKHNHPMTEQALQSLQTLADGLKAEVDAKAPQTAIQALQK